MTNESIKITSTKRTRSVPTAPAMEAMLPSPPEEGELFHPWIVA